VRRDPRVDACGRANVRTTFSRHVACSGSGCSRVADVPILPLGSRKPVGNSPQVGPRVPTSVARGVFAEAHVAVTQVAALPALEAAQLHGRPWPGFAAIRRG
jgi:hypothetical protein